MIAIIPCRTLSKRLPNKNHLPFAGTTLTELAVDCANRSELFKGVWLTSNEVVYSWGKTERIIFYQHVAKPPIHIDDKIETATIVFDLLAHIDYETDSFCVLNPTSPLRTPEILRDMADLFKRADKCVMSWCNNKHDGTAIFCKTIDFLRCPDFHKLEKILYFMNPSESVDIDTREDFERAERMYLERMT